MNLAYVVLLILFVIYVPIYLYIRKSDKAREAGFDTWGPAVMIRTRWGLGMMDRAGSHKRLWHAFGTFSLLISFLLMLTIIGILVLDVAMLPSMISSGKTIGIEYAFAIPGLNPMLPLVYGIIGLVIAMVVHELAHGIQSRANDVTVKSSGILYGVVPLGAFVEPDDEEVRESSRRTRMHIFAAGITTNFVTAAVLFVVMFATLNGCMTSDHGDNPAIYAETYDIGIPVSAIITGIDGTEIEDYGQFTDYLKAHGTPGMDTYDVTYLYKGTVDTVNDVRLCVYMNSIIKGSPADKAGIPAGSYLLRMSDGINDTNIDIPSDFTYFMSTVLPGDTISATYMTSNGTENTVSMIAGERNGKAFFGATATISGLNIITPNEMLDAGINPFHGRSTISEYAIGVISYIGAPIRGFSPIPESCAWWYECTVMDTDTFWIIIYVIYWTFWLNLVLGVSNALPAMPFDGGYLFKDGMDWLLERMGVSDIPQRENLVNVFTNFVSSAMLLIMILIVIVMVI